MPSLVFDDAWLKEYERRTGKGVQGENPAPAPKRSKYGNVKVQTEDGNFDSKHEARVWEELKLRARAGEFMSLARQVTFYLPGGVRYVADFVVTYPNGMTEVMDAKSKATKKDKVYRIKKRLMYDTYKIEIREV